jgi:hypothetical protein
MIRTLGILVAIFLAVTVGVHFGYKYLEQELEQASCVPASPDTTGSTVADAASASEMQQNPASQPVRARQDFQIIVRRDIFQVGTAAQAAREPIPEPEPMQEAVPTSLNLTLAGTMLGDTERTRAIVVDNAKREQVLLRVGDGIQGAVVKTIEWNQITLNVNGKLEVLEMPDPDKKSSLRNPRTSNTGFRPPPALIQNNNIHRRGSPPRPRRRISLPDLPTDDTSEIDQEPELPDETSDVLSDLEVDPTKGELPELINETAPSDDEVLLPPMEE